MESKKKFIKRLAKYYYLAFVHIFALIGFVLMAVFLAVNLKLTNTKGSLDEYSEAFNENAMVFEDINQVIASQSGKTDDLDTSLESINKLREQEIVALCRLKTVSDFSKSDARKILSAPKIMHRRMILAFESKMSNHEIFLDNVEKCQSNFDNKLSYEFIKNTTEGAQDNSIYEWANEKYWQDVKTSITKDQEKIKEVAQKVGIEPRQIVSSLMVEQLRLFYSQRELYKKFFEPLKILANSYQISLGVMSIKEETAIRIEKNLKDRSSIYYLGEEYEHMLDYKKNEPEDARFKRLTASDHYWNYLYGALYLKQFLVGWDRSGYNINDRPEILATLFNVGFPQSKPNGTPKVGGSTVVINNKKYTFGRLAYEFYYSGQMMDIFGYGN